MKPFINKYNWEEINFPSSKDDWKKFEKNNLKIVANFLYDKRGKIYHAYVSKHNWDFEKQVILLMTSNREEWQRFAVKKLSALSREITSNHHLDFYFLICLHSFSTEY